MSVNIITVLVVVITNRTVVTVLSLPPFVFGVELFS